MTFPRLQKGNKNRLCWGFPGGSVVKNPAANTGDTVQSVILQDPTRRGATRPVNHNYWACALESGGHNYWSPRATEPELHSRRSHCNAATREEPTHSATREKPVLQQRPSTAKNNFFKKVLLGGHTWGKGWGQCSQGWPRGGLLVRALPCSISNVTLSAGSWRDQALSLWSGSIDFKTLDCQKTNPREYQIVRTHTKETTWI